MNRFLVGLAVAGSVVFAGSSAFAQGAGVKGTGAAAGGAAAGDTKDYGYEFTDDPLSAGGFGPGDARINVRPGPVRTTLIKPRTTFVPEMLKSVENL